MTYRMTKNDGAISNHPVTVDNLLIEKCIYIYISDPRFRRSVIHASLVDSSYSVRGGLRYRCNCLEQAFQIEGGAYLGSQPPSLEYHLCHPEYIVNTDVIGTVHQFALSLPPSAPVNGLDTECFEGGGLGIYP